MKDQFWEVALSQLVASVFNLRKRTSVDSCQQVVTLSIRKDGNLSRIKSSFSTLFRGFTPLRQFLCESMSLGDANICMEALTAGGFKTDSWSTLLGMAVLQQSLTQIL